MIILFNILRAGYSGRCLLLMVKTITILLTTSTRLLGHLCFVASRSHTAEPHCSIYIKLGIPVPFPAILDAGVKLQYNSV